MDGQAVREMDCFDKLTPKLQALLRENGFLSEQALLSLRAMGEEWTINRIKIMLEEA